MIRPFWFMAIALVGLGQASGSACKYSVRDVAFVDLGGGGYRLIIVSDAQTPAELTERLHGAAAGVLVDANVRLQMARADDASDTQLKSLLAAQQMTSLPAAILVASDGRSLPIAVPSDVSQANLWAAFERVVASPVREKVLDAALKSHSVVLVIEGSNDQANQRAKEIANGAIDQARRGLAGLPKPIEQPPHLLVISPAEAARESVLLWSLQIDRHDDSSAYTAVLYGRGRRLGPVLEIPGATRTELSRLLWYVGQDCECDLDRSWMQGPMIPHRWDMQMQARAVKQLGFDAGSPMVVAEISRILSRGPAAKGPVDDALGLDDPLMGYREFTIIDPADSANAGTVSADGGKADAASADAANANLENAAAVSAATAGSGRRAVNSGDAEGTISAVASAAGVTPPPAETVEMAAATGPAAPETADSHRRDTAVTPQGPAAGPDSAVVIGIGSAVGFVLVALIVVAAIGGGLVWVRRAREV